MSAATIAVTADSSASGADPDQPAGGDPQLGPSARHQLPLLAAGENQRSRCVELRQLAQQRQPRFASNFPTCHEVGQHDCVSPRGRGESSICTHPRGELLDRRRLQDIERLALRHLDVGIDETHFTNAASARQRVDECAAERTGPDHRDHRHARWNIL